MHNSVLIYLRRKESHREKMTSSGLHQLLDVSTEVSNEVFQVQVRTHHVGLLL